MIAAPSRHGRSMPGRTCAPARFRSPRARARAAMAGQSATLGSYPAPHSTRQVLPPQTAESQPVTDPGIVFEIAAPDPNPADPTGRSCLGPAKYARLNIEYAENVLESPGIV